MQTSPRPRDNLVRSVSEDLIKLISRKEKEVTAEIFLERVVEP